MNLSFNTLQSVPQWRKKSHPFFQLPLFLSLSLTSSPSPSLSIQQKQEWKHACNVIIPYVINRMRILQGAINYGKQAATSSEQQDLISQQTE